jgi:hypothetical protein
MVKRIEFTSLNERQISLFSRERREWKTCSRKAPVNVASSATHPLFVIVALQQTLVDSASRKGVCQGKRNDDMLLV